MQLNWGEGQHAVARAVFHSKKGELRQRYREGMEDQLGALGLVVNALELWNTRYLQQALEYQQAWWNRQSRATWPAFRPCCTSTSTCWAATTSPCPQALPPASCARCAIRPLGKNSPAQLP